MYCLYTFFFFGGGGGLIRSLADSTLAAFIVCGLLQFVTHLRWYVPQTISKISLEDGGESSIVSDCTRE